MARYFYLFFLLSFFIHCWLQAQTVHTGIAPLYSGMNAYSKMHSDVFSFSSNQAALAAVRNWSVGVFTERRFLVKELNTFRSAFAFRTSSGCFGLKLDYMGDAKYNECSFGLAYGRSMGKIDAGIQFTDYLVQASSYGTASSLSCELGFLLHVTNKFQTGMQLRNPTRSAFAKISGERLPLVCSAGFGYDASALFFLGVQIEKAEDLPLNVQAGFHYSFNEKLSVQGGISSSTSSIYFGVLLLLEPFHIGCSASFHPQLGACPGLLFLYQKATNP